MKKVCIKIIELGATHIRIQFNCQKGHPSGITRVDFGQVYTEKMIDQAISELFRGCREVIVL